LVDPFTTATRAEPGNLWFNWSRKRKTRPSTSWSRRFGMPRPGRACQQRALQAGAEGYTQSARVDAEDHQPDHRCDRLV
jgi:hypothetical protein